MTSINLFLEIYLYPRNQIDKFLIHFWLFHTEIDEW